MGKKGKGTGSFGECGRGGFHLARPPAGKKKAARAHWLRLLRRDSSARSRELEGDSVDAVCTPPLAVPFS